MKEGISFSEAWGEEAEDLAVLNFLCFAATLLFLARKHILALIAASQPASERTVCFSMQFVYNFIMLSYARWVL